MAKIGKGFQTILDNTGSTLKANGVEVVEGGTIPNEATLTLEVPSGYNLVGYNETYTTSKVSYYNVLGYPVEHNFPKMIHSQVSSVKIYAEDYETIEIFLEIVTRVLEVENSPEYDFISKLIEYDGTLEVNGLPIVAGSNLAAGDVIILTVGEGYKIAERASLVLESAVGEEIHTPFIIVEDTGDKIASLAVPIFDGSVAWFNLIAEQVTELEVVSNNVYLIDYDKLKQINIERYSDVPTPNGLDRYDYGVNILSVLNVPFTIPEKLILNPIEIMLGTKQLTVTGSELKTDLLTFDLGEITYQPTEGNTLDYANKVFTLHLPYGQAIVIAPEYIVNQTISIEYRLDLYSGVADVLITTTTLDTVIYMQKVDIGITIPYSSTNSTSINVYNDGVTVGGFNDIYRPYLEIIENPAHLPYGMFTNIVPDEGVLGGFDGYITVDNIDLEAVTIIEDANSIISLLSGGVIIKDA